MQEVLLRIEGVTSDNDNRRVFNVLIDQGANLIETKEDLLEKIKTTFPAQKGIIDVNKISSSIWQVTCSK